MLMAFEKIGSDSGHRKAMVVVTDGVDDSLSGGRALIRAMTRRQTAAPANYSGGLTIPT